MHALQTILKFKIAAGIGCPVVFSARTGYNIKKESVTYETEKPVRF